MTPPFDPVADPIVDVAIVGGGITGLSAAWTVQQTDPALRYAVLESGPRWGGKILTETAGADDAFIVEGGPDSFITQKPWALQLARELGLGDRLLPTNDDRRRVYVLNRGRLTPLPDGVMLIVPTKMGPFVRSPLISPLGKLRMGLDLLLPARRDDGDETLADFITRRLGREALDKIAEPLMSGIYNAEAERQSLLATFPRFRALEAQHGSLIRGMLAARQRGRGHAGGPPTSGPPTSGPPTSGAAASGATGSRAPSLFTSLRGGMCELVDALVARLTGDCRLNAAVTALAPVPGGTRLTLADGGTLTARAVILALPAYAAARLVQPFAPEAAQQLAAIRYVSTGTLSLAYREADVPRALDGFGVVIPRSADRPINAVTWTSTKFNHRAPADHALLRVFFGGSRTPETMALDDDALLAVVRRELAALLGIRAAPLFSRIYRWHAANPQYDVGHLDRVAAIEAALPPGIAVTGSPYRGVGVPDCIHQAQQTAAAVCAALARQPAPVAA